MTSAVLAFSRAPTVRVVSKGVIARQRGGGGRRKVGCRVLCMSESNPAACFALPGVCLEGLSDAELLTQTRTLVGRSNRLLAELLAHLGEVEARGIHRTRACSSLYTYCIYELRFSEDEAFRRVAGRSAALGYDGKRTTHYLLTDAGRELAASFPKPKKSKG
jgi:hypothetical protein